MLGVKVEKKNAESVKQAILKQNAFARGYSAFSDEKFVYFPVLRKIKLQKETAFVNKTFPHATCGGQRLSDALKSDLSKSQLAKLVSSYDLVGDIAIIEIPKALESKKKTIGKALLASNGRLRTVLRKASAMNGKFRVRKFEFLAGEKKTETVYKESGGIFKLDLAKTYFSIRLSHERLRIADQVREGEKILALFAGVGPFPIIIARRKTDVEIVAIELNPLATRMMKENVLLNGVQNKVKVIQGDVNEILPAKFKNWADRIIMPLPHTGENFLDASLKAARKGCIVHFYGFNSKKGKSKFS
ncbi:MAG: class I SAM-dependent methyltransferase family protein, partial [Candidatus Micrarchaeota archaeon]